MGVDHGGRGGQVPPEFGVGTLMQIVPLRFLSYRNKKERSVAFKIRQNPFSAGAPPRTPMGELMTLPQTHSRLQRDTPSHTPLHLALTPPLGARHASPSEFRPDLRIYARVK